MDVNQNYCQSCHLISRNGFIIRKIMSSQICCKCMGNVITLSECICSVQRVLQSDFRKDTILRGGGGLVINLVQRRNGQDRTKILENNKNIQSIISVNTNILLRRFRLKFLRMMCSRNASTSRTTCVIHISAAQNSREHFYFHKTV
jgi:hypothetical protein